MAAQDASFWYFCGHMNIYKLFIKPLLFALPPEKAHHTTMFLFNVVLGIPGMKTIFYKFFTLQHPKLETTCFGLNFKNAIGLAAGFDKDGKYLHLLPYLGFGFVEIGTVTPRPQSGNPKPRLFRLPEEKALINRMGFNNDGADILAERLKTIKNKYPLIIGGNIGKNKDTPNEHAIEDYLYCFRKLYDVVDYFVVNVSSPNTPGLRDLQEKKPLTQILEALMQEASSHKIKKPVLLKIAPDLSTGQLDDIVEIVKTTKIDGIIATNTTLDRSMLKSDISYIGAGGLSGQPVTKKSNEVLRYLFEKSKGTIPMVGVGGILTGKDALERFESGASLIQVYTGLVYEGPGLIKNLLHYLIHHK